MVYDIGNMVLLKNELNDINYLVVDYGIDVMTLDDKEEKVRELINKNKNDIDNIEITFEDDKLYVTLEDSVNMTAINNIKIFKIKSSYVGYIDNGEKMVIQLVKSCFVRQGLPGQGIPSVWRYDSDRLHHRLTSFVLYPGLCFLLRPLAF